MDGPKAHHHRTCHSGDALRGLQARPIWGPQAAAPAHTGRATRTFPTSAGAESAESPRMPEVGTGPGNMGLSEPARIMGFRGPPCSRATLQRSGATGSRISLLALPLPAPTHRHPVRVFLPNLFTFLFPIFEGMVLFILELHDGPQVGGLPGRGLLRALVTASRFWPPPGQCQPYHNRSARVSPHTPVTALRGQTSKRGTWGSPRPKVKDHQVKKSGGFSQELGTQKHQGGVVTSRGPAPPRPRRAGSAGWGWTETSIICVCVPITLKLS